MTLKRHISDLAHTIIFAGFFIVSFAVFLIWVYPENIYQIPYHKKEGTKQM